MFISAGQRGLQMKIAPRDLIEVVKAETVELV
jgi:prolyl-tRNA editing enzyme YbaK/EbsC (Cys-tRNA(Pro) deacylase)